MSSHHFVKEGQEPALIILEIIPFDVVKGLLEWAPTVVVAGQVIEHVLLWGIKVDVVIFESEPTESIKVLLEPFLPLEIIQTKPHHTLRAGLDYLLKKRQPIVNVATSGNNPFSAVTDYLELINVTFVSQQGRWTYHPGKFKKWVPLASSFQIVKSNENQPVHFSGLTLGVNGYEAESEGWVSIESKGPFWVMEKFF